MSTEHARQVVVTGEASALRRRLGPTGWVVFEELLLASTASATACCASVSVRSLAVSLGLAKDTVARALVRLRAAGLVAVTQSRSAGGAFAASSYELRIPPGIIVEATPTSSPTTAALSGTNPTVSTNANRRRDCAGDGVQLSLLTP